MQGMNLVPLGDKKFFVDNTRYDTLDNVKAELDRRDKIQTEINQGYRGKGGLP